MARRRTTQERDADRLRSEGWTVLPPREPTEAPVIGAVWVVAQAAQLRALYGHVAHMMSAEAINRMQDGDFRFEWSTPTGGRTTMGIQADAEYVARYIQQDRRERGG